MQLHCVTSLWLAGVGRGGWAGGGPVRARVSGLDKERCIWTAGKGLKQQGKAQAACCLTP